MTQSLKKHFLELLLTELTKMVSLKEAKIASLAGSGIEARLWREKGVPAQNAWLIDSNPAVIRTMLKKQNQHPYHLYTHLNYWPHHYNRYYSQYYNNYCRRCYNESCS